MHTRPVTGFLVAAGVLVAGLFAAAPARAASHHQSRQGKQAVAVGRGGAVASVDLNASRAGIAVLRRDGNAVDAAVAVASTMGVTEPFVAGPGGGGFMLIYLARSHRVLAVDGREKCPAACNPRMFLDRNGDPLPFETARRSGLSVGVPGMVRTWSEAVHRFGRRSFAADLHPAIRRAERGFVVDRTFRQEERIALADLRSFTTSRRLFLRHGDPLPVGTRFRNPDLARTYRLLAARGPGFLYRGRLGREIAHTAQHPPVYRPATTFRIRKGHLTARDLRDYTAPVRRPTHVRYRGLGVYGMPPSSSGGLTIGEALNILSRFPLGSEGRAKALFQYLEASRLAFADRNAYIGDTAYVNVPEKGLLDPKYAKTRACLIKSTALHSPVAPGNPYPPYGGCGSTAGTATASHEGTNTNHIVVTDRWGNAVSYTNTIEQFAGSGMTVPGRGFLLNNEMTDFDFAPATPTTYDPNLAAPGKRPRSSMSPTIVLKHGRLDFLLGSPGGATIITTVLQILLNHVDFGLSLPDAIAAPRVSQTNGPTSNAEPAFFHSALAHKLTSRYGEKFAEVTGPVHPLDDQIGAATGIQVLGHGRYRTAAEPVRRGGGSALVVHPSG